MRTNYEKRTNKSNREIRRKRIEFRIGAENRPHLEKIDVGMLEGPFFAEQYKYMLNAVNRFCLYNKIEEKEKKEREEMLEREANVSAGRRYEGEASAGSLNNIFYFYRRPWQWQDVVYAIGGRCYFEP